MSTSVSSVSAATPASEHGSSSGSALRVQWYLFFPGGGIGRYTHAVLQQFEHVNDVDTELACLPSYEWLSAAEYRTWTGLKTFSHANPMYRKMRFVAAQAINPLRLWRRARERRADIVHLSNINHLTYPFWRRRSNATSTRIVATAHDVRRGKAMVLRPYEDSQLRQFYRRADALFVHSRAQVEELIEFAKVSAHRIHIVPHGPYNYGRATADQRTLRRRLGWPLDKQIALFFGNIRDDKNLDLLLQALRPHSARLHLIVAGRSAGDAHKPVTYYRMLAERLGIAKSVTFIERYVGDAEIPDLFTAADWATLPYGSHFTSQSGVLNVAVSYRRPVLLSATPTFVETLEQTPIGVLAAPDDVDALESGIGEIVAAVASGREFGFDEYERHFSWDANVRITREVYRALCD